MAGFFTHLRQRIGFALIGSMDDVNAEVEAIYAGNWPKHAHYDAKNRSRIKAGLLRARRLAKKAARTQRAAKTKG